ncbi:hypothetical protein BGZ94_004136 [Podila epigama]|nr:hypothetical protein BGZ94_004136 [Podila epigama]
MRTSFTTLLVTVAILASGVAAQEKQPETALPCYQEKCSALISAVKPCGVTVDPSSGNINFTVVDNDASTDKCLCTQPIVDAFDPCFICGAENQKTRDSFSTQNLVNTCNANFGANTVRMPGSAASSSRVSVGSMVLAASTMVLSMALML